MDAKRKSSTKEIIKMSPLQWTGIESIFRLLDFSSIILNFLIRKRKWKTAERLMNFRKKYIISKILRIMNHKLHTQGHR